MPKPLRRHNFVELNIKSAGMFLSPCFFRARYYEKMSCFLEFSMQQQRSPVDIQYARSLQQLNLCSVFGLVDKNDAPVRGLSNHCEQTWPVLHGIFS